VSDWHALIVRPNASGYEIISGHHRALAAERAGLETVLCWVREMSDEEAYMALALHNAQSELSALEIGLHALGSGLRVREYAMQAGVHENTLHDRVKAARVVTHVRDWHMLTAAGEGGSLTKEWHILNGTTPGTPWPVPSDEDEIAENLADQWRSLTEIHAAPQWLWCALAARMVEKEWTVEQTREGHGIAR
jgi:ParB-like chromosome segregation protein Spo0J